MTDRIVLANARLVLDDRIVAGSVTLQNGLIADLAEDPRVTPGAVDCGGDLIAPGLIELHTDNLERHLSPRPGVDWPHDAAILAHDAELAGCGITTVFDALRVGSFDEAEDFAERPYARALATEILALRAAGHLRVSHHLHLRAEICSHTLVEELDTFGPEDRVGLVSLMDHTPGQRQFADDTAYRAFMRGRHGLSDAEFDAFAARLKALTARVGAGHETAAIAAARRLGAVLASHDDTIQAHVRASHAHGMRIAEFPTTFEAARACRAAGIAVMMGAPNLMRGGSHSGNVAAGELARNGLLDILSSDYVPAALLTGAMRLARMNGDLPAALATVTAAPARAAGLDDRGRIAAGLRADLVRLREIGDVARPVSVWAAGTRVA